MTRRAIGRLTRIAAALVCASALARSTSAQERPLDTVDPEPVGAGRIRIGVGATDSHDTFYPLSGLEGDLLQVALLRMEFGISSIADFELSGGPYDQLSITNRQPAPLASLVTATGSTTHAVDDIQVATKIRLLSETDGRPALSFRVSVRLPNAKHESGIGQDTTDFSAALLAGKTWGAVRLVGNGGFTIMSEPLDAAKQNDVVIYGASLTVALSERTALVSEVNGRWSTRPGEAPIGTESRGQAKLGIRQSAGAVRFDVAGLVGLTSIDPKYGVTFGITTVVGR